MNIKMIVDVVNQVRLDHANGGFGGGCLVIGLVTKVHLMHTRLIPWMQ